AGCERRATYAGLTVFHVNHADARRAFCRHAGLVPALPRFWSKAWMPASSAGMTAGFDWASRHRQAVVDRHVLEALLRAGAEVLDDFRRGEGAEAGAGAVIVVAGEAEEEARGEEVAGAGGIHELVDGEGRHRRRLLTRDDEAALFRTGDDAERALAAEGGDRRVEVRRLVEALQFVLVGEDDVDLAVAHQRQELVAVAVDAEGIGQRDGNPAAGAVGDVGSLDEGLLGGRRIPE